MDSSVDEALRYIFAYLDLGFTGMALSGRVDVDGVDADVDVKVEVDDDIKVVD